LIKKHSNVVEFTDIQVDINTYAGIDEVGRGPLAGPVIAAAVVLGDAYEWQHLKDSKRLSSKRREAITIEIKENALAWAVGRCEAEEIDRYNIFNASLLAMKRAFEGLSLFTELALVDGKYSPELSVQSFAIIKGDHHVPAISAASILAKVTRDLEMCELDKSYPHYGFAKHKGYPTTHHMDALRQHGACIHHRRSFKPVASVLK
jgi:ribonuclease HII